MEYDSKKVAEYYKMMENYDNEYILNLFETKIPKNKTVLELGFGTGQDYLRLKKNYKITASDYSEAFIEKFKELYQEEVIQVNAITMNIDQKFDCIYSSKVLNSLREEDIINSLTKQYDKLNQNGFIFHTLWYGSKKIDQSFSNQKTLEKILNLKYEYVEFHYYKEANFVDSLYDSVLIVARKI